ncbi:hypothetical protein GH714_032497 [Hevea brasiliensis]|uniref:Uncharacterized protein n=1 Tax=Hevea brasiliensis TaxID=3981 RepID=A0A6A6N938_HEVBR|nr:hypothetical protein GH714_032497 [Hevea brasiliensis]
MSETVQIEPGDTITVASQCGTSEALQQSSEDATKNTLAENLDPPSEDARKSGLTDKSLGPKLTAIDQKLEFGSEDTRSGPSKEQYSLSSGIIQDQNALSTFTIDETLQRLCADAAKNSLAKDLELPCEEASKSSQIVKSPCPKQSTYERTLEFSSDIACCEPSLEKRKACCDIVKGELVEISTTLSSCTATGHLEPPPVLVTYLGLASDSEINIPDEKLRHLMMKWINTRILNGQKHHLKMQLIFCAKCGAEDLTADNDIILCDVPPDDEGWLCPGCDCKVDCIELLNDSQGTNISISDSWEKVFPEAAAAGQNPDQNFGLPSDDSDDNDYDPNGPEIGEKSPGNESSSDESCFTSASDELEAPPGDEQHLGLPSDDSEDDDYNPDGPDLDQNLVESSNSDFTSDSEDLAATLDDKELSGEDESRVYIRPQGDITREGSNHGGKQKQSLQSELLSILEPSPSQDGSVPISGKRNVERLDYKKLYNETYGSISSDSSDDEDFTDTVGPRKRRKSTEVAPATVNGDASVTKTGKQDLKETEYTPKRSCQQPNFENTSIPPAKAHDGSSPSSSCGKTVGPSICRRLGEAVTQHLFILNKNPRMLQPRKLKSTGYHELSLAQCSSIGGDEKE